MKKMIVRNKETILVQALYSGSIVSLFIYVVLRGLFYEFPMSWGEEILFFTKTILGSCFLFVTATGIPAGLCWLFEKKR